MDWDSDSDAASDDSYISELSDDKVEEVQKALGKTLKFPTSCPVCSACKYKYQNFRSKDALVAHAKQRVADTHDRDQLKARPYHEALIQKMTDAMEVDTNESRKRSKMTPAVRMRDLGEDVQPSTLQKLDAGIKEMGREKHEIDMQKKEHDRRFRKTTTKLEEVKWQLAESRQKGQEIRELMNRKVDSKIEELNNTIDEQTAYLRTLSTSRDALEKRLNEPETMTQQEKEELTMQLMGFVFSCHKMEKEKNIVEQQLKDIQREKEETEAAYLEAVEYGKKMDQQIKEAQEICEPVELDSERIDQLKAVGLDPFNLPKACLKCKKRFETSAEDTVNTVRRVVLGICRCVDYCQTCVSNPRFERCPVHNERIGEAVPFTYFS